MRLSHPSLAAAPLCLALSFTAAAQTAAPSSLAKPTTQPTTQPTEIIVVGGKPANAARTGTRPVVPANGSTAAATSTLRSGNEMSMMELQSQQSKRSNQIQLTTDMAKSTSDGQKRVAGNVGK